MRRLIAAASWALLACAALASLAPAAPVHAAAAAPVAECVAVTADPVATGMSIRVHNACEVDVRCEIAWKVRCEGDDAVKASQSHAFGLTRGGARTFLAGGDACGDAVWEITDESWSCVQRRE